MTQLTRFLLAGALMLPIAGEAVAQDEAGRSEAPPQSQRQRPDMDAAWTLQAMGVARGLALSDEQATQLVEAYVAERNALNEAIRGARQQGRGDDPDGEGEAGADPRGGDRGDRGGRGQRGRQRGGDASPEMVAKHQAQLSETITVFLEPEQVEAATASLATFSRQWDRMVISLGRLELEEKTTYAALDPIEDYVVAFDAVRQSGDRETMRESMRELMQDLEGSLEAILSAEQLETFKQQMRQGSGRRGQGGQGGQRGGGRGGRGGPDELPPN